MNDSNTQNNNQGIIITGGTFTENQFAAGAGATNTRENATSDQEVTLLKAFEELKLALEQSSEHAEKIQALEALVKELQQPQPNTFMAKTLLQGLEESVGHVVGIAGKLAPFVIAAKATLGLP